MKDLDFELKKQFEELGSTGFKEEDILKSCQDIAKRIEGLTFESYDDYKESLGFHFVDFPAIVAYMNVMKVGRVGFLAHLRNTIKSMSKITIVGYENCVEPVECEWASGNPIHIDPAHKEVILKQPEFCAFCGESNIQATGHKGLGVYPIWECKDCHRDFLVPVDEKKK
jgi:hypothetical protein